MAKKPILLISKPCGHKRGEPIVGFPSRLVDPVTRQPIPGIGQITLNIPIKGMLTCTAQISLGGIEVVEEDKVGFEDVDGTVAALVDAPKADKSTVEITATGPLSDYEGAKVEAAEAAGLSYEPSAYHTKPPRER